MKTKMIILTFLMAFWAAVGFASSFTPGTEPVDPMEFGRNLLRRIEAVQAQRDTLEAIIGDEGAYRAYRGKTVQEVIERFTNERAEPEASFFKTLNGCVEMGMGQPKETMTMSALLKGKKANLDALERFLESTGVDIAALREEKELAKVTAAAAALETMPSKEDVFRGDFRTNPDLGRYLHFYLTTDTFDELLGYQNALPIAYGIDFIESDQRLPAIFAAFGRAYRVERPYLWRNLIEIIADQFCGGAKDDRIDGYLHKLKYNDTWDINKGITRSNHHNHTPKAYEWLTLQDGTRMVERVRRGLRL